MSCGCVVLTVCSCCGVLYCDRMWLLCFVGLYCLVCDIVRRVVLLCVVLSCVVMCRVGFGVALCCVELLSCRL